MLVCNFTDFEDVTIIVGDETFRFAFSSRFGPTMIGKRGQWIEWMPPRKSRFWDTLWVWSQQGHRVDGGTCVFDWTPVRETLWSPDGRNFVADTAVNRAKWASCVIPEREVVFVKELRAWEG